MFLLSVKAGQSASSQKIQATCIMDKYIFYYSAKNVTVSLLITDLSTFQVYWAGPLTGATMAALLYQYVFSLAATQRSHRSATEPVNMADMT